MSKPKLKITVQTSILKSQFILQFIFFKNILELDGLRTLRLPITTLRLRSLDGLLRSTLEMVALSGDLSTRNVREEVLKLMEKKLKLENQIRDMFELLSVYRIGLEEPLVDKDGYPRADIDLNVVTKARQTIRRSRNNLKEIMLLIEKGITEVHRLAREAGEGPSGAPTAVSSASSSKAGNGDGSGVPSHAQSAYSSRTSSLSSLTSPSPDSSVIADQ